MYSTNFVFLLELYKNYADLVAMKKMILLAVCIFSFNVVCNAETLAHNKREKIEEKKEASTKKECECTCTCHKKEFRKKELAEAIEYYKNSPYHTFTSSR
ncbi:MAG: hypothetical protein PHS10_07170 [Thiovulaceae bacterium]|nr:hypothetical protein [Sulfurimonadaceae bacterium]